MIEYWRGQYIKFLNFKTAKIKTPLAMKKNKEYKNLLTQNAELKNKHIGERCFIVGNGPSLKSVDFNLLRGETIISVNQINRHPDFALLKPKYHFWADASFFKFEEHEADELLEIMRGINKYNTPKCFFPIEQLEVVKKYHLDSDLDVAFFDDKLIFYDNYGKDIDFAGVVPAFPTVVQYCIILAMYMGFKEIYLLGCDNTSILVNIQSVLNADSEHYDYAYEVSEKEKKRMRKIVEDNSLEAYARTYYETFKLYRELYSYCKSREIKLVNCSTQTVIESIPRKKLEDVIGSKNNYGE